MKTHDYTTKIVYVGIDVHKKTYSCVSICDGEVVKRDTMPADPALLLRYLKIRLAAQNQLKQHMKLDFLAFIYIDICLKMKSTVL